MKKQSKYQEVVSYLKNGIESGRFPTGSRLPSIRQLSLDFHCSKDTIQRALLELRYEQYLYAKPQSGYYVLEQGLHQDLEIEVTDEHARFFLTNSHNREKSLKSASPINSTSRIEPMR